MTTLDMSGTLLGNARLWRYLSLDKLIDLLSTGELFFAPLSFFAKADPFEGYLPMAAMSAFAEIFGRHIRHYESFIPEFEDHCKQSNRELRDEEREMLRHNLKDLKAAPKLWFEPAMHRQTVSCWHANDTESEAMWKLYADNGKAVAIETTVNALKESIMSRESQYIVHIYPVRYLDFFDKNLKATDCVVERHTTPLLKRASYQHENEVRAFIGGEFVAPSDMREFVRSGNPAGWEAAPVRLPVDVKTLVKRVHVSPYSREPFMSSVAKVCQLLGLQPGIVETSNMLSGQKQLLKVFDY